MRHATRCCRIAFHSSCTRRRKSARLVFSSTRQSTARFTWSHKCSIGLPPSKDTHLFATFEMGYPFIQSVLIQALKQLWDWNHDSSVAMTQLFMCAKNHFDWLNNFGNTRPNPKGNLFLLNCLDDHNLPNHLFCLKLASKTAFKRIYTILIGIESEWIII